MDDRRAGLAALPDTDERRKPPVVSAAADSRETRISGGSRAATQAMNAVSCPSARRGGTADHGNATHMTTSGIADMSAQYLMPTYSRASIAPVRGSGVRVWDADGREYLDFLGGIAVCGLGHCHPAVVAAIEGQARALLHCSNLYLIGGQALLAKALLEGTPFGKAFFCNSGAEANEAAIKLARKYAKTKHGEGRYEIISAWRSFHGRTLATITATGQPHYQKGFEPLPAGFRYVPFGDVSALQYAIGPDTAAVLLEPVQGEGGVNVPGDSYFKEVRRICDASGVLLILDEVQTGLGRTGKMFAFEHYGIEPDAVTLAKALGGGVPIGALLATDEVARVFTPGTHASTFGGNPLACAAALAVLTTMKAEGVIENAAEIGRYFMAKLGALAARCPQAVEVRGKGLMVGMEFKPDAERGLLAPARDIVAGCTARGLLVNAVSDTTVRFLPPLIVKRAEVDEAVAILEKVVEAVFPGNT